MNHSDKDRIILVSFIGKKGSGAVIAYESTKALIEQGWKTGAIISDRIENKGLWESLHLEKLVTVKSYHTNLGFIFATIWFLMVEMYRIRRQFKKYHVMAVYNPMIQPWSVLVNTLFPKAKKLVTVHDPELHSGEKSLIFDILIKWCCKQADELIVLCTQFREYCAVKYRKRIEHVHVIPHGDFSYYKRIQQKDPDSFFHAGNINFLFFGRISQYKGLKVLAQAYTKVCQELDNATLTIAGSGNFNQFADEFKELPNIRVLNRWFTDGKVGNLFDGPNIIAVLPYLDATQSGVIPLAIEYHVPVIASRTGGLSEQIIDHETGILTPAGDHELLAQAMISLGKDPDLVDRLTSEAWRKNEANSWDKIAKQLLAIIQ